MPYSADTLTGREAREAVDMYAGMAVSDPDTALKRERAAAVTIEHDRASSVVAKAAKIHTVRYMMARVAAAALAPVRYSHRYK